MKPWLAINARNLLEHRQQGWTVDGPVVVSMVGGEFAETALYVKPDMPVEAMDWRMLVNLPVWVWASVAAPIERIVATAWRIAQARPKELHVRFEHKRVHDVYCGDGRHAEAEGFPSEHSFLWMPMNVGWTDVGAKLCAALRKKGEKVAM